MSFDPDKYFPSDDESVIKPEDIRALTPEELAEDAEKRREFGRSILNTRALLEIEDREEAEKRAGRERKKAEQKQKQEERDAKQKEKEQWHRDIADRKSRAVLMEAKTAASELTARLLGLSAHERALCPALLRSIKADLELALESL